MKRFIKAILIIFIILNTSLFAIAQIAINEDGSSPDASAMLDVSSNDKGLLVPRMTTAERTAISSPATGLLVYDTDENTFWYYTGSEWIEISNQNKPNIMSPEYITSIDIGTQPVDIERSGNYLYVVEQTDDEVKVYDISNPINPTLASSLSFSSATVLQDMVIDGNYAYVTSASSVADEFKVLDISDPTNISLIGEFDIGNELNSIEINGNYAYVFDLFDVNDDTLRVIDISTPSTPTQVGEIAINAETAAEDAMTIDGDYLYLGHADGSSDLTIVDISSPSTLSITGNITVINGAGGAVQIIKKGDYIYYGKEVGLSIIDVSTPASPTLLSNFSGEAEFFTIYDDYLFSDYVFNDSEVEVYDISTITAPSLSYTITKKDTIHTAAFDMMVVDGYLYLAENDGNLNIYQITTISVNALAMDGTTSVHSLYDDLGDHTAAENIQIGDYWFSNDGDDEGISISEDGNTTLSGTLTIDTAYTFPSSDGNANQHLITDGSGTLTWSDISTSFISENDITHSSNNNDDFVFGADSLNYGSGTETKLFFDKSKGAFRVGGINGKNWDEDKLGKYSIGLNYNSKATGESAIAGNGGSANGYYSTALGSSIASSSYSTAFSTGYANGQYATAFGGGYAHGDYSTAFGNGSTAKSYGEFTIGLFNTSYSEKNSLSSDSDDRLFVIGNGTWDSNRSDAMIVYKSGDTEINGALTLNDAFTFPTADGTASQVLITDGSGTLSWSDLIEHQTVDTFTLSGNNLLLSLENDGQSRQTVNLSTITPLSLVDTDNDTKIQVEESSDEDIIRFDLGGTEFMRLDSGRIEILNTGSSVFLGEGAGANDNYTDNRNTFIGHNAGTALTTGYRNVYLGYKSGAGSTSAYYNTYLGFRAGFYNTTGNSNTFIGYDAGFNNITGNSNVFLGNNAGYSETGSNKLYIDNSNTSSPLIYGEFDNNRLVINGNDTINSNNRTLFVNGSIGATSAFNNDSDRRLKEDIQTIPNALDKVLEMRGVTYKWKDGRETGNRMGFIAQEVEPILPQVVDNKNDHYTMQYAPITAVLIEAVKEQQVQIEQLKINNIQLENLSRNLVEENKALKAEIQQIHEMKIMLSQLQAQLNNQSNQAATNNNISKK